MLALAASGRLSIPVALTIPLAQAPAVITGLERGQRLHGKVVIAFGG